MANCNTSCPYFHYVSIAVVSSGELVLTFSDSPTGLVDKSRFCFRFSQNISLPSGYASLPVYATVNGTTVPLWNKYGDILTGADLVTTSSALYFCPRYTYHGYFGSQTSASVGDAPGATTYHISVNNSPRNTCHCV